MTRLNSCQCYLSNQRHQKHNLFAGIYTKQKIWNVEERIYIYLYTRTCILTNVLKSTNFIWLTRSSKIRSAPQRKLFLYHMLFLIQTDMFFIISYNMYIYIYNICAYKYKWNIFYLCVLLSVCSVDFVYFTVTFETIYTHARVCTQFGCNTTSECSIVLSIIEYIDLYRSRSATCICVGFFSFHLHMIWKSEYW